MVTKVPACRSILPGIEDAYVKHSHDFTSSLHLHVFWPLIYKLLGRAMSWAAKSQLRTKQLALPCLGEQAGSCLKMATKKICDTTPGKTRCIAVKLVQEGVPASRLPTAAYSMPCVCIEVWQVQIALQDAEAQLEQLLSQTEDQCSSKAK